MLVAVSLLVAVSQSRLALSASRPAVPANVIRPAVRALLVMLEAARFVSETVSVPTSYVSVLLSDSRPAVPANVIRPAVSVLTLTVARSAVPLEVTLVADSVSVEAAKVNVLLLTILPAVPT